STSASATFRRPIPRCWVSARTAPSATTTGRGRSASATIRCSRTSTGPSPGTTASTGPSGTPTSARRSSWTRTARSGSSSATARASCPSPRRFSRRSRSSPSAARRPESCPTAPRSRGASRRRVFDSLRAPAYDSPRVMADHILESRVWLARARTEVFAFFASPENLVQLTPPSFHLEVVAGPARLTTGAVLHLTLSRLGVPLRWRAFIREWDPPFRFVDVQVRGPYARWEHRHRFLEERGGTWVEDRITYRLPLGPLGRVMHALCVR